MKILIVDDHILFRQGLVGLLRSEPDFEVVGEAGSTQEALRLACALKPDIILMDYELPDGTGAEVTPEILKDNPDCKVVFLTVHEGDEQLIEAMCSGAVGYLLKDMPIDDLLCSLHSVCGGEAALSGMMTMRILEELTSPGKESGGQKGAFASLTLREQEVLREIMLGASNREIADRLSIGENTVKHHIHNIFGKLGVNDRRSAANYARKYGLK